MGVRDRFETGGPVCAALGHTKSNFSCVKFEVVCCSNVSINGYHKINATFTVLFIVPKTKYQVVLSVKL